MYNIVQTSLHPFQLLPVLKPAGLAYNSFCRSKSSGFITALIDSGASFYFLSPSIVYQYGLLLETHD